MKRLVALVLTVILIFALGVPAFAAERSLVQLVYEHNERLLATRADHPVMPEVEISQAIIDKSNEIVGSEIDEEKKLRLIFDWVCDNIVYDGNTSDENQMPDIVLESKRAVCAGFTNLSQALALAQGIPCYYISGSAGGWNQLAGEMGWKTVEDIPSRYGAHAWNEAFVNGRWVTFDSTIERFDMDLNAFSTWHLMRLTYTNTYTYSVTQVQTEKGRLLFDKRTGALIGYEGEDTMLTIPSVIEGVIVAQIEGRAFSGCTTLERVVLPDSITYISGGFSGCTALKEVVLPDSITYISGGFSGCTALERITIPDNVTSIGLGAFKGCTALTEITLPDSVVEIGGDTFRDCTGLTEISIPDGVTKIGDSAFRGCTALTGIVLPDGVTEIDDWAFYGCTALTKATLSDGITEIGKYAFRGCTSLIEISIPGSLISFGGLAFEDCTSLTRVTLLDGVTRIGSRAFFGCTALKTVAIPKGVTEIGKWAFDNCDALTDIYYGGTEAQWAAITVADKNDVLTKATVHYYSALPENRVVSAWAKGEVDKAEALGLIPNDLMNADLTEDITRAEFAAVAVKLYEALSGKTAVAAERNPFSDTEDPNVLLAYGTGLTNGMSATTFQPETLLSREQAATILTRVYKKVTMPGWTLKTDGQFKLEYTKPAPFVDDDEISGYAKDSVYFMAANNIIEGIGGNKFAPRNITEAENASGYANATRQVALILAVRMVENLGK